MARSQDSVDEIAARVRAAIDPEKIQQLNRIARLMVELEEEFRAFLKRIRARRTATFSIRASRVKSSVSATLSVRVRGVECGTVRISKRRRERLFRPKLTKHFKGCWTAASRQLPWEDAEVRRYLERVTTTPLGSDLSRRECGVEAALIQELKGRQFSNHRPVLFPVQSGVPYQFPVPVSASGDTRRPVGSSAGHIDVLARCGRGRSTRLRVLELKKPTARDSGTALHQAVTYAVALDVLMDEPAPYLPLLGFPSFRPCLEATAVVGDNERNHRSVGEALKRLQRGDNSVGIRLSALFYDWERSGEKQRLRITRRAS